jgi:hypothetical protein
MRGMKRPHFRGVIDVGCWGNCGGILREASRKSPSSSVTLLLFIQIIDWFHNRYHPFFPCFLIIQQFEGGRFLFILIARRNSIYPADGQMWKMRMNKNKEENFLIRSDKHQYLYEGWGEDVKDAARKYWGEGMEKG